MQTETVTRKQPKRARRKMRIVRMMNFDKDVMARLKARAKREDTSVSWLVRKMLREALGMNHGGGDGK